MTNSLKILYDYHKHGKSSPLFPTFDEQIIEIISSQKNYKLIKIIRSNNDSNVGVDNINLPIVSERDRVSNSLYIEMMCNANDVDIYITNNYHIPLRCPCVIVLDSHCLGNFDELCDDSVITEFMLACKYSSCILVPNQESFQLLSSYLDENAIEKVKIINANDEENHAAKTNYLMNCLLKATGNATSLSKKSFRDSWERLRKIQIDVQV